VSVSLCVCVDVVSCHASLSLSCHHFHVGAVQVQIEAREEVERRKRHPSQGVNPSHTYTFSFLSCTFFPTVLCPYFCSLFTHICTSVFLPRGYSIAGRGQEVLFPERRDIQWLPLRPSKSSSLSDYLYDGSPFISSRSVHSLSCIHLLLFSLSLSLSLSSSRPLSILSKQVLVVLRLFHGCCFLCLDTCIYVYVSTRVSTCIHACSSLRVGV
jgi:hypothetical protein